jgi:hypothetical protein
MPRSRVGGAIRNLSPRKLKRTPYIPHFAKAVFVRRETDKPDSASEVDSFKSPSNEAQIFLYQLCPIFSLVVLKKGLLKATFPVLEHVKRSGFCTSRFENFKNIQTVGVPGSQLGSSFFGGDFLLTIIMAGSLHNRVRG